MVPNVPIGKAKSVQDVQIVQAVQNVAIVSQRVKLDTVAFKDESFKDFVLDQLQDLDDVAARPMFGGYGLYHDETFFGILYKGRLYFKIDEDSVGEYRKRKMKPFRPNARQTLKTYYEVPVEFIEDRDKLIEWACKAIQCRARKS